jgi:3-oxoacyl-[acyl-carrier protein] reductase
MASKVAVVTGASRGIGRAIALALANSGMRVVLNYLTSTEETENLAQRINEFSQAKAIRADVADARQVQALVDETLMSFGRVDVLINNAGSIPRPGDWQGITDRTWQRTLDVNLSGVFNCIRYFAPIFLGQKSGNIINISSIYGMLGAAPVIAYTAAKAGVINLTRSFAKELAPFVNVNAIAPGVIDTEMTRSAGEEMIRQITESTPLKRLGRPEEIADLVCFLSSPKAAFITGQIIVADGGYTLR